MCLATTAAAFSHFSPVLYVGDVPDFLEYPLLRALSPEHADVAEQNVHNVEPVTYAGLRRARDEKTKKDAQIRDGGKFIKTEVGVSRNMSSMTGAMLWCWCC